MAYTDDQDFQPISPYEGYTSDQIRGFVDKSLSNKIALRLLRTKVF